MWANGCMDQDATWYRGRPRPTRDIVFDVDPVTPRKRAHPPQPIFGPCLLWPNRWMDEDAAWYGSRPIGSGHIVLDGVSAPAKRAQQPPLFGPCLLWPRSPVSATAELLLTFKWKFPVALCQLHLWRRCLPCTEGDMAIGDSHGTRVASTVSESRGLERRSACAVHV